MSDVAKVKSTFYSALDAIKIETREGAQVWYARDIQEVLGYARWENFAEVIEKAKDGVRKLWGGPREPFS